MTGELEGPSRAGRPPPPTGRPDAAVHPACRRPEAELQKDVEAGLPDHDHVSHPRFGAAVPDPHPTRRKGQHRPGQQLAVLPRVSCGMCSRRVAGAAHPATRPGGGREEGVDWVRQAVPFHRSARSMPPPDLQSNIGPGGSSSLFWFNPVTRPLYPLHLPHATGQLRRGGDYRVQLLERQRSVGHRQQPWHGSCSPAPAIPPQAPSSNSPTFFLRSVSVATGPTLPRPHKCVLTDARRTLRRLHSTVAPTASSRGAFG